MTYDYRQAIINDVTDYIHDNIDLGAYSSRDELDELADHLYDTLWNADSVTGNARGALRRTPH